MALVFRLWVEQGCGNGLVRGWIGYDDVSLAVTRVRYENTATNADMDFQLFKPESESPDGTSIFDGAVHAGTPLTTRNIQGIGLAMKASPRDASQLVPDDWTIATRQTG